MDRFHPPTTPGYLDLRRSLWLMAALVPLVVSCSRHEEIIRDTVPKPEQTNPELHRAVPTSRSTAAPVPQRTLGAIILTEDAGALFKLVGDAALVQSVREDFVEFVESVRFADGRSLHLFPPKGWDALPGDDTRLATIRVPSGANLLELVVSQFPRSKDISDDEYVLLNVNRWREQMRLGPIQASDLSREIETIKAGEHDVVLVDIVDPDGVMDGLARGATPQRSTGRADSTAQDAQWPIEFNVPPEWVAQREKGFRVRSFVSVGIGNGTAPQIVTIMVSKGGGDRRSNVVNLWRSHVELPPWSADEMAREIKKIETLGTTGDYVQLVGRESTFLGVIAEPGGDQWFIELSGPPELAERERSRFEAFVKSLRLRN